MRHGRLWAIWGISIVCYIISILNRSSLSAVGIEAADRYSASAATLSIFSVLQLFVYGALQIPVGLLIDKIGPRLVITLGMVVMTVGQLSLALSVDVPQAVTARVLVGAGDAMIFPSILRIIAAWFPLRQAPLVVQTTGMVGSFGQLLSVIPLAAILRLEGWTTAFLSAAGLCGLAAILGFVIMRDSPTRSEENVSRHSTSIRSNLRESWKHPGTRLAFWTHFSTSFAGNAFALLWGYPYLTEAEGLSIAEANWLFSIYVIAGLVIGPVIGALSGRHPIRRSWILLAVIGSQAAVWALIILWAGPAPMILLAALMIVLCAGGPGSMIAFDYARTHNPIQRLSSATGMINVAGFFSSLVTVLLIGVALDLQSSDGSTYSLQSFRLAMCIQFVLWGIGVSAILHTRRQTRAQMALDGVHVRRVRDILAERRGLSATKNSDAGH